MMCCRPHCQLYSIVPPNKEGSESSELPVCLALGRDTSSSSFEYLRVAGPSAGLDYQPRPQTLRSSTGPMLIVFQLVCGLSGSSL